MSDLAAFALCWTAGCVAAGIGEWLRARYGARIQRPDVLWRRFGGWHD